jgi:hypothetical protein
MHSVNQESEAFGSTRANQGGYCSIRLISFSRRNFNRLLQLFGSLGLTAEETRLLTDLLDRA